ncbi:SRPBCC family protein [Marivita hallyeonensis]|uniref:Polyketide cyclase / dehydrase and lipid transport n=1 Tax=Marivita hallyeonensis TaxID=996342 RepID=A0A1M5N407_9RHOB|nr:SRPBCC family protein [Marivita hallyeonensis]SHG83733.1 Polyketide cyclase / dehydrase and lipid transport [Marivita hallyeonensis]
MTHHVRAERTIPVEAADLWQTVSKMTGMEDWYPELISDSAVTDVDGREPARVCTLKDGAMLKERVILRDVATRTFCYAIDEHGMPAKNVVGTIRIDDLGDGNSFVSWSANLMLEPENAGQFAPLVQGMYEAGLASLEAYHCK